MTTQDHPERLRAIVAKLTAREKKILRMYYIADRRPKSIGRALYPKIKDSTVRSQLRTIRYKCAAGSGNEMMRLVIDMQDRGLI